MLMLSLGLIAGAQAEVVSRAYEVALGNFRAPVSENGSAIFKTCDDCQQMIIRVTPHTVYTIRERQVRFKDFRKAVQNNRSNVNVAVTVLHHLESDTVESINVSL